MNRRDFIKYLSIIYLGSYFIPQTSLGSVKEKKTQTNTLNHNPHWLIGSPAKGCSTSNLATEFSDSIQKGLDDFNYFRMPKCYA